MNKRSIKNRILALILALSVCLTLIPQQVLASDNIAATEYTQDTTAQAEDTIEETEAAAEESSKEAGGETETETQAEEAVSETAAPETAAEETTQAETAIAQSETAETSAADTDNKTEETAGIAATLTKTIRTSDNYRFKITVSYDASAGIPEDAQLKVSEVTSADEDVNDEDIKEYIDKSAEALDITLDEMSSVRLFDISILGSDGTEYQPDEKVSVSIEQLNNTDELENAEDKDMRIVHFGDEPEELEAEVEDNTVTFETEGFSLFSLIDITVIQRVINAVFGNTDDTLYENDDIVLTGKMPLLGSVEATPVTVDIDGTEVLVAYDIKIYANSLFKALGITWQPTDGAITVTVKSDALEGKSESVGVYHLEDADSEAEYVTEATPVDSSVTFEAEGFSVYAITDTYLRTYSFYSPDASGEYHEYYFKTETGETVYQQIIKTVDGVTEALVIPQLPSIAGSTTSTFAGWYVYDEASGTLSDEPFDFENIPAVTATEEVKLYAKFASYVYVIFHEQYNGSTNSWPIAGTKRGEVSDGSATVDISDVTVTYDDSSDGGEENSSPEMAFRGWSLTKVDAGEDHDVNGDPVQILESPLTITANTDLYPVFVHINWLTFVAGPTGSGATYSAPRYYYTDEGETDFPIPTRTGYIFDGWYTEEEGGTKIADADGALAFTGTVEAFKNVGGELYITDDATLYGHWTAGTAKYTVVIWRQSIDDDKDAAKDERTYDYAESFTFTADTGSTVAVDAAYKQLADTDNDYSGFHYLKCDDEKTVEGNGSTILNVYYDRDLITFSFKTYKYTTYNSANPAYGYVNSRYVPLYSNGNSYYYLRYGSNISFVPVYDGMKVYTRSGNTYTETTSITYNNIYYAIYNGDYVQLNWASYGNNTRYSRTESVEEMTGLYEQPLSKYGYSWPIDYSWRFEEQDDLSSTTLVAVRYEFSNNVNALRYVAYSNPVEMQFYFQLVSGEEPDYDGDPDSSRLYNSGTTTYPSIFENMFSGFTPAKYKIGNGDWVEITDANRSTRFTVSDTVKMYFERKQLTLTFQDSYDNTIIETAQVMYQESLEGYIPEAEPASSREGYTFKGWYYDKECTVPVDFSKTMPAANMIIYAGWETIWYLIEIDPNGGVLPQGYSTFFWIQYGTDTIREYNLVTRNYIEHIDGTYYYAIKDRAYYGLGDEWEDREDDITDRSAYYTTDISDDAADLGTKYKEAQDAFRYAGWFEVDPETGEETLYAFGQEVLHDTYLRLHWKQIGTYYIRYDAGDGTLDNNDSNEDTFKDLDTDDYADHSSVIVTRTANAPEGYNFIGWTIRGGDGTIYYPGQAFEFQSKYSITETVDGEEKEVLILDAVYSEIGSAKVIYDVNGGTLTIEDIDYGEPTDPDAYSERTYTETTATLSGLLNNSEIRLSDGSGFSYDGAEFKGWNTKADATGEHFDADTAYYVDTEEPITLYAEWAVKVYFDKNNANADWGGDWDSSIYTWDSSRDQYYTVCYINGTVDEPIYVPVSSVEDERFDYWSLVRYTDSSDVALPYDFSTPLTGEITLYGFWANAIQVPYHVVDSSEEELQEVDWVIGDDYFSVNTGTVIPLAVISDTAEYVNVLSGYDYAFACVSDSLENCSEDNIITEIGYNTETKLVSVTYADGTTEDLPSGMEIYLIYFENPKNLAIGYKEMGTDESLTDAVMNGSGYPTVASAGEYNMTDNVSTPVAWADNDDYKYYAFAIGEPDASADSDLHLITEAHQTDSDRPALQVKNTWRGFKYSTDGGVTWTSCGYDIQLYVVYFEAKPTIITLIEHTIGTEADMDEEFEYEVVVTTTVITTIQQQRQTKYSWERNWGGWNNYDSPTETSDSSDNTNTYNLSDGESETTTLFYIPIVVEEGQPGDPEDYNFYTQYRYRTVTTTTTTQTIRITQRAKDDFTTDHDGEGTSYVSNYVYTYTTTNDSTDQTVTYTNTRTKQDVELHVALVQGGQFVVADDNYRINDEDVYIISIPYGDTETLSEDNPAGLFTGDTSVYRFAGIICGKDNGTFISAEETDISSLTFAQLADSEYLGVYMNGDNSLVLEEGYDIYYVYYQMPKIYYMKEGTNGAISEIEPIERNGEAVTLNNSTVEQRTQLEVTSAVFNIDQTASGGYRVPPDLDGDKLLSLDYVKIGVGASDVTNISGLDEVSELKTLQLKVVDSQVKWSLDGEEWNSFSGEPTVYIIYKEKGYDLTITKTVTGPGADPTREFTITIASDKLVDGEYAVSGIEDTETVTASDGTISLTVKHGSSITIHTLQPGAYTITEAESANTTMTAKVGGYNQTVTDNSFVVTLSNADVTVDITNTISIPAPTGVNTVKAPYIWMLLFGGLFVVGYGTYTRRRRKGGKRDE